ncbi:MAG: GNAT family N-acetyltransferase [Clostridia bacterium]|nr:GNAT family N-acetyltransferase [Clostridia bacterium]
METVREIALRSGETAKIIKASPDIIDRLIELEDRSINPATFMRITEEELADSIENDTVFVATLADNPIAFSVLVHNRDSERSLAQRLGHNHRDVLTFDGVIVSKEARGNGLQRIFLLLAEELALSLGASYVGATVSRLNEYSRRNFAASGFTELCEIPIYGSSRILAEKRVK